ncbi:MAG TPA: serine hydrolase domain-containing protein [Solirubrobacteraceae bacterium]|nr:serine hydrolase domain-containing protein [Solirubrobacteraceae bacterium]
MQAALRAAIEPHVGDEKIPGAVALVAHGEEVHVQAAGTLSVGGAPVRRDSLFRIASTSKPITAAATLALVDEGLLGLEEPVQRLLPELADRRVLRRMDGPLEDTVPAQRAVTVRDLLTFTFGFGMAVEMFMAATPWPIVRASSELRLATLDAPDPSIQPDPDTWIAGLGSLPLIAQPGERWLYNTGASVLGVLLARAAGQPLAEVLRTRLFEPLGMRDTAFWATDTDRLATAYRPSRQGMVVWDEPSGIWSGPPPFPDGAAGLVSTVDDLLAFGRMLLRGGAPVLSPQSARAMATDQLTDEQKAHGGLGRGFFEHMGWSYGQAVHEDGSYGWDGGFGCSWRVDPARETVMVVLTQRMWDSPVPPAIHDDVQAAAHAATR